MSVVEATDWISRPFVSVLVSIIRPSRRLIRSWDFIGDMISISPRHKRSGCGDPRYRRAGGTSPTERYGGLRDLLCEAQCSSQISTEPESALRREAEGVAQELAHADDEAGRIGSVDDSMVI